jgi:hypothetical protein
LIYLYWYLGVGVCIVLPFVVRSRILKKDDLPTANDLLEALQPERKSLWYRLRSNVLAPLLTGLLVVPFWPFVVYLKVQDMVLGKHEASNLEEPKFAVVRADLLERVSIAEIEQCERVFDPLSAVPDLPFGHLNTAWRKFLEDMTPDAEMWTFSAHWTDWGSKELRRGYVMVRGNVIGPYFLTTRKDVDEGDVAQVGTLRTGIPGWLQRHAD